MTAPGSEMLELEDRILTMSQYVREQLSDALAALSGRDTKSAEAVVERDDVIDNIRAALEDNCFSLIGSYTRILDARRARGALRVVYNLERIGDSACHIAKQCLMLASEGGDQRLPLRVDDLAPIALAGVDEGVRSFIESDIELAQRACQREPELDAIYVRRLNEAAKLIDMAKVDGSAIIHALAVLKQLEKVCDFVLNIGETTVYSLTGMRITYGQLEELRALLPDGTGEGTTHRHFWDGVSGATVVELGRPQGERLVFKEGAVEKIEDEFYKTLEWEGIAPTHTPRVIGITHGRGRSGILREFAEGTLLLDLLLSDVHLETKEIAMRQVTDVLRDIWTTTITPRPPKIDYTQQIRSRLRDVLRRHPQLEKVAKQELEDYGGLYDLLSYIASNEAALAPPFSIWIHGDLNADNIVMDAATQGVVFIDVHRSHYGDYLQDVSVLATSPIRRFPRGKAAKGVRRANDILFDEATEFGSANGDRLLKARLHLGRARALMTSARLETDSDHAGWLFLEGLGLLKKVAKTLKVRRKD